MDKPIKKNEEKDFLTWDILEKHVEEFLQNKKDNSEYVLMMEKLKKNYSLPCKDKTTNKLDKTRGYYGC